FHRFRLKILILQKKCGEHRQEHQIIVTSCGRIAAVKVYVIEKVRTECPIELVDIRDRNMALSIPQPNVSEIGKIGYICVVTVYAIIVLFGNSGHVTFAYIVESIVSFI